MSARKKAKQIHVWFTTQMNEPVSFSIPDEDPFELIRDARDDGYFYFLDADDVSHIVYLQHVVRIAYEDE